MSDFFDPSDGEDDEPAEHVAPTALRRAAREGARAKAENEQLKRELAFMRAGIDVRSSPLAQLFDQGYRGDVTDEAVAAAWAMVAPPAAPIGETSEPAAPEPEWAPGERSSTSERQALSSGAAPDVPQDVHPGIAADLAHERVIANGGTSEDALAARVAALTSAAASGDQRVIVQP